MAPDLDRRRLDWSRRLDAELFRESPAPSPLTPARFAFGLGIAAAGVLAVLLRLGLTAPLGSIWAEDGGVFLQGALNHGFFDAFQATYAGYLHVVPRLFAELTVAFPIEWAPEIIAISGAAAVVLSAFVVWWASAGHLPNSLLRGVLAAMVILLPVVGYESLASIAYVSWFMVFAAFWLLLWRPASFGKALAGGSFVALTLMNSALGLLLAPLALLRAVAYRDRSDLALLGGFMLGAAVQAVAVLSADHDPNQPPARWDMDLIPTFLQRVVGGLFFGYYPNSIIWIVLGKILFVVAAAALAALIYVSVVRKDAPARWLSAVAIALAIGSFFIGGYLRDLSSYMLWEGDDHHTLGARHTIFPVLLLFTVILLQLQRPATALSPRAWMITRRVVLAAIAVLALTGFYVGARSRSEDRWSSALEQAKQSCLEPGQYTVNVEINPVGLGWFVTIPCSELGVSAS
jgi:hypothetical protein